MRRRTHTGRERTAHHVDLREDNMSTHLYGSVGVSGRNLYGDVCTVQRLLKSKGMSPGPVDGRCGPLTVNAILAFQHGFLNRPDGCVDVNGVTWQHLSGSHRSASQPNSTPSRSPAALPAQDLVAAPTYAVDKALTKLVAVPTGINKGVTRVSESYMIKTLGHPRTDGKLPPPGYDDGTKLTNPVLIRNMTPANAIIKGSGSGLKPAVESLQEIMNQIQVEMPNVRAAMTSAGMKNCRRTKLKTGWGNSFSNHSWGTAIDIKFNGDLDNPSDNVVQVGLALIAPIFNAHGWFWGAGFGGYVDAMHFEAGRGLVDQWAKTLK
jgi:peptidoglycan hydrolase-like protein with peptidoglycan-binding domain